MKTVLVVLVAAAVFGGIWYFTRRKSGVTTPAGATFNGLTTVPTSEVSWAPPPPPPPSPPNSLPPPPPPVTGAPPAPPTFRNLVRGRQAF